MLLTFLLFSLAQSSGMPIYIGKITSQVNPNYNFDSDTFPICKKSGIKSEKKARSFAINFVGNSVNDIGLEFQNMVNVENQSLCRRGMSKNNFIDMRTAILQNMHIQFIVNGTFSTSVPIGTVNHSKSLFYYSHWNFSIYYLRGSIIFAHALSSNPIPLSFGSDLHFTYSISSIFVNKNTLPNLSNEEEVKNWYHYYSLLKICVYIITVICVLGYIITDKITNDVSDFQKDSQFDDFDENRNQFHWRLLHGDIFRIPKNLNYLSSFVGSSLHLIFTFLVIIFINLISNIVDDIGFFNVFLIVYIFSSFLSGFVSISISDQFGETHYLKQSIGSTLAFAIPSLLIILLLSILTNFSLFSLNNWFITLVLVFILLIPFSLFGGYFVSKHKFVECPCEIAAIPRKQPTLPFLMRNYILFPIIGSICSFLFIHEFEFLIELFATGNKKWFSILFATVFFVSIFFISSLSIVLVYILIKKECYWWQWRAFLAPFCSSFYLFIYLLNHINNFSRFQTHSEFHAAFLIAFAGSYLFGLICGGIGFLSANVFIQILFSNLKFS